MGQIGVCLVGAGRAGMIHAHNLESMNGVKIVSVCDPDEQTALSASSELGCDHFLDFKEGLSKKGIDCAYIASPTKYHAEIVEFAAEHKIAVFCEKPMALDVDACQKMIDVCKKNDVLLQLGFMRRFDSGFKRAKQMIAEGKIGKIVSVRSLTHGPSTPHEWMYDIAKSNGPLAEVCSHDIDTIRWLTGSEFKNVYALAGNYRSPGAREEFPDFYDSVILLARMADGTIGNIDGAQGVQYGYDARVEILGENGLITIGGLQDGKTTLFSKEKCGSFDVVKSWMYLFAEAYMEEDKAFIDAVRTKTEPLVTGLDGLEAVKVVKAGNLSIATGKTIQL